MTHCARSYVASWIQPPCSLWATPLCHGHCQAVPSLHCKDVCPQGLQPNCALWYCATGGKSITTELSVGFQFHLPYLTRDGSQTSLLIATRLHVTVNIIVGLLFIQATQVIIDLSNNVANLCAIDAPPSPLNTAAQQCKTQPSRRVRIAMST
jgi:hypothetical protein